MGDEVKSTDKGSGTIHTDRNLDMGTKKTDRVCRSKTKTSIERQREV